MPRGPAQNAELQHGLLAEQAEPRGRHIGGAPHVPELHVRPLQHVLDAEQLWPVCRHTGAVPHTPPRHDRPEQHALALEHV